MRLFILICAALVIVTAGIPTEWVGIPVSPLYSNYLAATWPATGTVVAAGFSSNGGSIIKSMDYGVTWTQQSVNFTFGSLYSLTSRTLSDGNTHLIAIADNGEIYSSIDYGTSWRLNATVDTQVPLYGVSIAANGNAFICGDIYSIFRATLPGSSWSDISPTMSSGGQFFDVSTYDGTNVIAVGSRGRIYYSANSGDSWSAGTSGVTTIIYSVSHGSALTAIAAGTTAFVARTTVLVIVTSDTLSSRLTLKTHSI
jgi:photosystem II stability/assembly factor-like uncharacterized protein